MSYLRKSETVIHKAAGCTTATDAASWLLRWFDDVLSLTITCSNGTSRKAQESDQVREGSHRGHMLYDPLTLIE